MLKCFGIFKNYTKIIQMYDTSHYAHMSHHDTINVHTLYGIIIFYNTARRV